MRQSEQSKPKWEVVLQLISSHISRFIEEHQPHRWQHFVLTCIDGRFIVRLVLWLIFHGHYVFDFRTEVGSVKAIVDQGEEWKSLKRTIYASMRLHQIREFVLVIHRHCGAFEEEIKRLGVDEKEFMFDLYYKARELLMKEFGEEYEIRIVGVWMDWRGIEVIH